MSLLDELENLADCNRDTYIAHLALAARAEIEKLQRERDDADRRAGAVARTTAEVVAELRDGEERRVSWLNDRKQEVFNADLGYPHHTSFDAIWKDAFAALKEAAARKKQS